MTLFVFGYLCGLFTYAAWRFVKAVAVMTKDDASVPDRLWEQEK